MNEFQSSFLKIISFRNNPSVEKARLKFRNLYEIDSDYYFFDSFYLSVGRGTHHIVKSAIHYFIHGEIYDDVNNVRLFQHEFVKSNSLDQDLLEINGSFVILIINELLRSFYIITDRINSRKIYFYKDEQFFVFSTFLANFKPLSHNLNIAGVASCLINGVACNNQTLFANTAVLERASLHSFSNNQHVARTYWKYKFTNEFAKIPKSELKQSLADLLIQGVRKRISAVKPEICFLSLSGGYDSRFLLGALLGMNKEFALKTFSYGMCEKLSLGDDIVASELADKFNLDHHFESAYSNNLLNTISLNIKYGGGISNFCDEIDTWLSLSKIFSENSSSLLFVGDMYSIPSYQFRKVKDKRIPLKNAKVFPWQHIIPLLSILPKKSQELIISSYQALYQEILNRLPDTDDYQDLKDFAYLDQRISNTLMYWRENFHMPFIKVAFPILDNDILDFIRKLPVQYRFNKILYKETLVDMFPELYAIPMAKNIWKYPSWMDEIAANSDKIIKGLETNESLLDKLIPVHVIKMLINNEKRIRRQFSHKQVFEFAQKLSHQNDLFNNLIGGIALNNTFISRDKLIIRLLMIREALRT